MIVNDDFSRTNIDQQNPAGSAPTPTQPPQDQTPSNPPVNNSNSGQDSYTSSGNVNRDQYNNGDWLDLEGEKKAFSETTFVYEYNGTKITIDLSKCPDAQIKYNPKTKELVVINGNGVDIQLGEGQNISVIDSQVDKIDAKKGGETINLIGAYTNVDKITGGNNSQTINISEKATVNKIDTKGGDDVINIKSKGSMAEEIDTGEGDDIINVESGAIVNNIFSGSGADLINVDNAVIKDKLSIGDYVSFSNDNNIVHIMKLIRRGGTTVLP